MKKSYSIFLSTLFCFLFCSLSAQDAQLNAASRKVIIEAPAEPGTHLEVAYRPAGSFFPSYVQSGQQVDVGTTLIIDAYSDNPTKLPLVAVRVNGEEIEKSGSGYTYVIPEGEGDIVISAEFGLLYQVDFSYSLNGRIELYAAGSEEPLTTGTRVNGNVEITVKVIPDSGCDLLSLVVNDENVTDQLANNEYKFVLKKNTSITAAFQKAYRLTVEPFEHGSMRVAISDKGDLSDVPSDGKILDGQTLILWWPTVEEGYEVGSVLMNGTDITEQFFSETYNHVVKGDVNVTVTIRKKTYGLTVKDFVGGTIKAEFEDEGVVTDVSAGGRVPENATLKIYEPVLDEGYELVYVSLNGSDIKDQFKDGIYSLTMKEDVMLVVKAKEIDKMFKLTIDEIEGGSIDVQVYVGGDLADVPADGNIKNGTMLMISEPVLEDGYELVSVMLNEEDITALFEEGVYFHTMLQDVTISVKTNYVSGVEEEQADRVRIYPNPFAESCVVSGVAAGTSVRVFNMTGACVFSKVAGTGETEIRLSGLASGVYILKLEKDGDSSCHKLIRK